MPYLGKKFWAIFIGQLSVYSENAVWRLRLFSEILNTNLNSFFLDHIGIHEGMTCLGLGLGPWNST